MSQGFNRLMPCFSSPSVVTSPIGCDIEFGLIQKSLEKPPLPSISDVEGLNLNITVPAEVPDSAEACLPVICFVHGGGFLFGGTWAPHYDLAAFVAFSVSIGKPVVGVSIKSVLNYKLPLSQLFLTSASVIAWEFQASWTAMS